MSTTYNSWSHIEENMLLAHMLSGLQKGNKTKNLIEEFANTYNLTEISVQSKWQLIRQDNAMLVKVAKETWQKWGKLELANKRKEEAAEARRVAKLQKQSQKLRLEWKKEKAKRAKNDNQVRLSTNLVSKESDKRKYVKVDDHGVVTYIGDITAV
jgi:hypothetical protein